MVVSARKERPNIIIGADFLSAHDCDLSLRQKLFTVGRNSVRCLPERVRSSHVRLKLARRVELPPHSEVLISCKATQSIKHFGTSCAVAQPASNNWHYAEDGLVIGSLLVTPDKATHHIPVMSLSDTTPTLPEGTRLGDIYPVESFKDIQEMLWVDSDLSYWESDKDELTDVRATGITGKGASTKTHNARDDARMDPKDLPDHLQPLMEWISEDITTRKREELAAAIYEYRDVFSSGPEDMRQTDLVTHTIDTGEHRPICLPPQRLPITKQDVEKAEVQKMLDFSFFQVLFGNRKSPRREAYGTELTSVDSVSY